MRFIYNKQFTYFFALLGVAIFLVFLHARGWLKPVEAVFSESPRPFVYMLSGVGKDISGIFTLFASVSALNSTNASLKDRIRTLEEENVALRGYKFENEILRKDLAYREKEGLDLLSAIVIGKDPAGFSQTIILNAGTRDGVKIGNGALSQGTYIGKVVSADAFTSKVLLISDPQSKVDAQISGTQDNGILRGSSGSGLVLDMVSQTAKIIKDQEVVTAGLTDNLPKGILIGTIGDLQSQKNDLLQKVTVVSAVDLKNLHFISVLKQP